jgi:hypothetical protein
VSYFGRRNYSKGPDWYKNLWSNDHKYNIDASPGYATSKVAIEQIAEEYPEACLIFSIRCPVKRAISQYNHYMQIMDKKPYDWRVPGGSLRDNILGELERPFQEKGWAGILGRGLYHNQIQNVLSHFPTEQLMILVLEEWRQDVDSAVQQILMWLGLRPESLSVFDWNRRKYTISTTESEKSKLRQFYKKPNQDLFKFLGREPPGWE